MELPLRQTDSLHTGGGWTLVVSVSSKNNDYHQRPAINCWDSELCVPFKKDNIFVTLQAVKVNNVTRIEADANYIIFRNV